MVCSEESHSIPGNQNTTYVTRSCNLQLCLAEKLKIIKADKKQSLNRRTELVSRCRHENRFYLCNFPPTVPWTVSNPLLDFFRYFRFPMFCFANIFEFFEFLLAFSDLAYLFKFFDPFEFFEFLPALSILPIFSNFLIFFRFFLYIFKRSSSLLWIFWFFWFLWFSVFLLQSQTVMLVLPLPSIFSTLYLLANFCQFFPRPSCASYSWLQLRWFPRPNPRYTLG